MRWPLLILIVGAAACGGEDKQKVIMIPKAPNNELIVDSFERHAPLTPLALAFRASGDVTLGKDKGSMGTPLASGKWELDKDQLTLQFDSGEFCTPEQRGVYKVVLSKLGIRFTKVEDDCEARAKWDGQTFWRIK